MEVLKSVLMLPGGGASQARATSVIEVPWSAAEIEAMLREALISLARVAETGVPSRQAALSLMPADLGPLYPEIVASLVHAVSTPQPEAAVPHATTSVETAGSKADVIDIASRRPAAQVSDGAARGESLLPHLYDQAVAAVAADRVDQAIVLLGALLNWKTSEADALLGLAVCAAQLERYDEALVFATERLKHAADHPRACFIAGLSELKRSDRRAAQNYLAAAARMARRRPEFREDLRAAQRLLLTMHFA